MQAFLDPLAAACCTQFQLSPAEGRCLAALVRGDTVNNRDLQHAISGNLQTHPKNVAVTILKLRQKLADHGVRIITAHRRGYRLDRNTKKMLAVGRNASAI